MDKRQFKEKRKLRLINSEGKEILNVAIDGDEFKIDFELPFTNVRSVSLSKEKVYEK